MSHRSGPNHAIAQGIRSRLRYLSAFAGDKDITIAERAKRRAVGKRQRAARRASR